MTTIYTVAARAGVSAATVSRVFNNGPVSPEKANLVLRVAEELGFTPNRTARSLRRKNSEIIALVIPDIENPYFTSLARGVEDAAQQRGYSVVLCNTDDDVVKEAHYLEIAVAEKMAGVIIAVAADGTSLSGVLDRDRPVVAVDRVTNYDLDRVMTDDWAAGYHATEDLLHRGFRRVACITGPKTTPISNERARGWSDALHHNDIEHPELLRYSDWKVDGGRVTLPELLALPEPPDAVMVTNNLMGIGVVHTLEAMHIPLRSFGVAVIGDLPFTTISSAVTTIRLPVRDMGNIAVRMLIDRIEGDDSPPRTVILQNQLIPPVSAGGATTPG